MEVKGFELVNVQICVPTCSRLLMNENGYNHQKLVLATAKVAGTNKFMSFHLLLSCYNYQEAFADSDLPGVFFSHYMDRLWDISLGLNRREIEIL